MKKEKGKVLRLVVITLGVLLAPVLIQHLPDLTYTMPIVGGLLAGAVVYFILLYFGTGLSRDYLKRNSRWIWTPFIGISLLIIASFILSFFKVELPKESVMAYYVFAGLGVVLNIILNVKKAFPLFGKYKKRGKRKSDSKEYDPDDDDAE